MAIQAINPEIEKFLKNNKVSGKVVTPVIPAQSAIVAPSISPYNNALVSQQAYEQAKKNAAVGLTSAPISAVNNTLNLPKLSDAKGSDSAPILQDFSKISSLNADIEKAKQRAAEKSVAPTIGGGAVSGAMMALTNPINGVAKDLIPAKDSGVNPVYQDIGTAAKNLTPSQDPTPAPANDTVSVLPYQKSQTVIDAENYLDQLRNGLNGRSQYADTIDSLIAQYQNRDKFSYDPNSDMLYQNYLAAMQNNGLRAMKDTMGQAAALTGGYGSTYATAAANGAYNNYLQTANDNLQNFYNNALNAYNLEGEEMLNNLKLYQNLDDRDYQRKLQEYEMALNSANAAYDRDWNAYVNAQNEAWKQKNYDLDVQKLNNDNAYQNWQMSRQDANDASDNAYREWQMSRQDMLDKYDMADTDRKYLASLGLDSSGQPLVQSESSASAATSGKAPTVTETQKALKYLDSFDYRGVSQYMDSLQAAGKDIDVVADYLQENSPVLKKSHEGKFVFFNNNAYDKYQINGEGDELTMKNLAKQFGIDENSALYKALQKKLVDELKEGDSINLFELFLEITD